MNDAPARYWLENPTHKVCDWCEGTGRVTTGYLDGNEGGAAIVEPCAVCDGLGGWHTYNSVMTDAMLDADDDEPEAAERRPGDDGCLIAVTGILLAVVLPLVTLVLVLWPGGVW